MEDAQLPDHIIKKDKLIENIDSANETVSKYCVSNFFWHKKHASELLNHVKNIVISSDDKNTLVFCLYRRINLYILELNNIFSRNTDFHDLEFENISNNILSYSLNLQKLENKNIYEEIIGYRDHVKKTHDDIIKYLQKTKDLASLVAENAIKNGFEKVSNNEKLMANWLFFGAVLLFSVAVCASGWMLHSMIYHPITISASYFRELILYKFAFIGLVITFAYFLAKQSGFHRMAEHSNKKMALDLAALDPFIANMSEDHKSAVKKRLALKLFGVPNFLKEDDKSKSGVNSTVNFNVDPFSNK